MSLISPLVLLNVDVLQALDAGGFGTVADLARKLGRDASNLRKSLKALEADALVDLDAAAEHPLPVLTQAGRAVRAALARADATDPPPQGEGDRAAVEGVPTAALPEGMAALLHAQIHTDPLNPRKHFDEAAIAELAESIAHDGLLENLVVRADPPPQGEGDREAVEGVAAPSFRLVAGERRWRALRLLIETDRWPGDRPIACKLVEIDDAGHRRLALVENLQRKDLRPIDEAEALKALIALTGKGTADIAAEIGFTQRFVQQRLQLLELPEAMQERVNAGTLPIERARECAALWPKLPPAKQKELAAGRLTLETVRQWLAEQPEPLSLKSQLALAEFLEKIEREPVEGHHYGAALIAARTEREDQGGNGTKIRVKVEDHGVIAEWVKRSIVSPPARRFVDQVETGLHLLSLTWSSDKAADAALPGVTGPGARAKLIAALRAQIGAGPVEDGAWTTPWLNASAALDPAIKAEIKQKRDARAAIQKQESQHREAEAAKVEAARVAARGALDQIQAAEPALICATPPHTRSKTLDLAKLAGLALPLFVDSRGQVLDAAGGVVLSVEWYRGDPERVTRRLMVALINTAGGFDTPLEEPRQGSADDLPRAGFIRWVADCLLEDDPLVLAIQVESEAETIAWDRAASGLDAFLADQAIEYGDAGYDWSETGAMSLAEGIRVDGYGQSEPDEDEDAPAIEAADDAELPDYLTRLAGGAEARP